MDEWPKTLSVRNPESKSEWWTEGIRAEKPCSGLNNNLSMTWFWCGPEGRSSCFGTFYSRWNYVTFSGLGHIQRWVAEDASKRQWLWPEPPAGVTIDSRTSSRVGVNEPPAAGKRSGLAGGEAAEHESAARYCSAGCCEATHCRLCPRADIILFPTKAARETRGRRRCPCTSCGDTKLPSFTQKDILFFSYYVFVFCLWRFLNVESENGSWKCQCWPRLLS